MLDKETAKLMQAEQKAFGIAPGFKTFSPQNFGGMNQQSSRQGMPDNEFFLAENFIKIGEGNLRTLWDQGVPIYTATGGKIIVYYDFFNIGATNYCAVFLSDGTAIQVNMATLVNTPISSVPGTFYAGSQLPATGQWGSQYLLIVNNFGANDYWIWDGTLLYTSGTLGPIETIISGGSGYTSAPTVLVYGGSGSGAAVIATVSGGSVTSLQITNPGSGYLVGDTVQLLITGGGSDNDARLTAVLSGGVITSVTVTNGGTGFTTVPTLTVQGGGGSGATLTAHLTAGAISSVTVGSGGTGYTSVPAIVVSSGANRAAYGSVTLMPFGVSGASIETFQQRVWIPFPNQQGHQVNGGTFLVTAPGSLTDFATSDGGLTYVSTDSFLKQQFTNIKQTGGYLYPFGDSSVSVISNVQTSGNPITTTFNYQNVDPQVGLTWRDSLISFSRTLLFANPLGVYGLYGGAVTKVSGKMDNIFNNAIFPPTAGAITPVAAVANIFNRKVFLLLLTTRDPITKTFRNVMLMWDEKDWYLASQASTLTYIRTQEVNSNLTTYGTDGTSIFPLFNVASSNINKRLSTKLYGQQNFTVQKESMGVYLQVQDLSTNATGVVFSAITVDAEHGSYEVPQIPNIGNAAPPYYQTISMGSGDISGVNLGCSLTSNSLDFTLNYLGIGHIEISSIAMSSTLLEGQISTQ